MVIGLSTPQRSASEIAVFSLDWKYGEPGVLKISLCLWSFFRLKLIYLFVLPLKKFILLVKYRCRW